MLDGYTAGLPEQVNWLKLYNQLIFLQFQVESNFESEPNTSNIA